MRLYSLPKSERLLNRKDFVNLNRLGKRYRTKNFIAIYKKAETGNTRLGITVGRKVGNAVRRNRIKRLIREYYRLNKECFPEGYDIVIIAKKDTRCLNYAFIKEELSKIVLD